MSLSSISRFFNPENEEQVVGSGTGGIYIKTPSLKKAIVFGEDGIL